MVLKAQRGAMVGNINVGIKYPIGVCLSLYISKSKEIQNQYY